ncbi:response regulator [Algoriphagus sp. PAP.12]|uniref:response regulator n=1 Tax=Algoriphagus sp. PAP.12 TaxID=2996678 RepID=UPI00227AE7B2|nr:response regulator transcription factor [Algoriphagus sp. PAP.12]
MINVLIADDHQLFIDGLKAMLQGVNGIRVIGEANNGKEAVSFCSQNEVDLVIMDVNMPEMDGVEATKELCKRDSRLKILGLSMHLDRNYISDMLKSGANGYLLKNTGKGDLLKAIKTLNRGDSYVSDEVNKLLLNSFFKNTSRYQVDEKLSEREAQVLGCIANGLTTLEIGEQLFISKNTVETHRKNLLYKLKAKNTAELVNNAYIKGLIY